MIEGSGPMGDYSGYLSPSSPLYSDRAKIKDLTIKSGVETVGSNVFYGCSELSSVTFESPSALTSIKVHAFDNCAALQAIAIPDSVTSIEGYAFSNSGLRSITIPAQVKELGSYVFAGCTSLETVIFAEGSMITRLPEGVFNGCTSLVSVNIPETATEIGAWAFYKCSALPSITIPDGVESIGENALRSCTSLTSMTIPVSVTELGEHVFSECRSLETVTFAEGSTITRIPGDAFSECTSLVSVNVPETVTEIGEYAFCACSALPSITIPANVASIGYGAFLDCYALATIINEYDGIQTIGTYAFYDCGLYAGTEKRAFASTANTSFIQAARAAGYRVNYTVSFVIDGVEVESYEEVPYNSTIEAPDPEEEPDAIFDGWYTEAELVNKWDFAENKVTDDITLYAKWWKAVKTYNLGPAGKETDVTGTLYDNGLLVIQGSGPMGDYRGFPSPSSPLHDDCADIKTVIIESGVETVGANVFYECTNFASITIPDGVMSIGESAFDTCTVLESITIPASVAELGAYAFWGCVSLTSITIPEGVNSIGASAFEGCTSLTTVIFAGESTITTLPPYTFWDCWFLTSVNIPETVTEIGKFAFHNCIALPSITIPARVEIIGEEAFRNCTALATIINEYDGVQTIGTGAFYDCGRYATTEKRAFAPKANASFIQAARDAGYRINYTVSFVSNGGSAVFPIDEVPYNSTINKPSDPTKYGFVFDGWYKEEGLINKWDFLRDTVTSDITLYAKWTTKTAIAYSPSPVTFSYGTAGAAYTVSYLDLTGFDVQYCVNNTWTATPPEKVGSYDVYITRAEDETYASYDSGILPGYFVIEPAKLTVSVNPEIVIAKVYDGDTEVEGEQDDWLVVHGLKDGETATASGTWSYADADAGTGKMVYVTNIVIKYGTAESSNYTYTPVDLSTTRTITNAPQSATDVEIDYIAETVSTTDAMQYSTDGMYWADCNKNMAIAPGWFGRDVYFRLKAKPNYDAGEVQTLNISPRPATPAATGTGETYYGQKNGTITGVNADMEYKAGAEGNWRDITGTELTNLAAGTYYIRVKATASNFRSLEQELVLPPGEKITVHFEENGGSDVADLTDLSYDDLIPEPSPPTCPRYTFGGWYKDEELTDKWDFEKDRVTSNLTLYAKWEAFTIYNLGPGGSDSVTGTLYHDGRLVVTGSGPMGDFEETTSPLYDDREYITTVIIESGVESVGRYMFSECYAIESVTIPESVTSIGSRAFADCLSLTSVNIPESVTVIGEAAFSGCREYR
ncbi:MAG: leucine-rich repeat protein [bacterium]